MKYILLLLSFSLFAEEHHVEMIDYAFSPRLVIVKEGDTVTWTNTVRTRHNVRSKTTDRRYRFKSKFLKKGGKFSHKFKKEGTYDYYCSPHRRMGMFGTIIVEEK